MKGGLSIGKRGKGFFAPYKFLKLLEKSQQKLNDHLTTSELLVVAFK